MPSPVGHSLIGLTLGVAWLVPPGTFREVSRAAWSLRWPLVGCIALGNLADVDYVPGICTGEINAFHHYFTHTPGWCLLVAAGIACWGRFARSVRGVQLFLWSAAILLSHLAADIVCEDGREPRGIMALWPLSDSFFISPVSVFTHLRKDEWSDFLQWHNAYAVAREIVVCLPLLAAAVWMKMRRVSSAARFAGPVP